MVMVHTLPLNKTITGKWPNLGHCEICNNYKNILKWASITYMNPGPKLPDNRTQARFFTEKNYFFVQVRRMRLGEVVSRVF